MTHVLFRSVLFSLHMLWDFLVIFLLLISSFNSTVIWEQIMYDFCSEFVRCVLWPRLWSILVTIPCELGKNVYSAVVVWNNILMCIINCWSIVLLSSPMSSMIFCLWGLSISERSVEASTMVVDISLSPCSSISFALHSLMLCWDYHYLS